MRDSMNRVRTACIIALAISASLGVAYAVRTYIITQQIGGFPAGSTSQWVIGTNQTLGGNICANGFCPPPVNSSGLAVFQNAADVTCGGLNSCNVTVTAS